jgi:hypothetical protein
VPEAWLTGRTPEGQAFARPIQVLPQYRTLQKTRNPCRPNSRNLHPT